MPQDFLLRVPATCSDNFFFCTAIPNCSWSSSPQPTPQIGQCSTPVNVSYFGADSNTTLVTTSVGEYIQTPTSPSVQVIHGAFTPFQCDPLPGGISTLCGGTECNRVAIERAGVLDADGVHSNVYEMGYGNWDIPPQPIVVPIQDWQQLETSAVDSRLFTDPPSINPRYSNFFEMCEYQAADERSLDLLREWLTPEEFTAMMKIGMVLVPSQLDPDKDYIVLDKPEKMVSIYHPISSMSDGYLASACIGISEEYPRWDRILAKILLLKTDEQQFLEIANLQ